MTLEDLSFQVGLEGEDVAMPCDLDCLASVLGLTDMWRTLIIHGPDGEEAHLEFERGEDLATVLDQADQCLAIDDLAFDTEAEERFTRAVVPMLRALV